MAYKSNFLNKLTTYVEDYYYLMIDDDMMLSEEKRLKDYYRQEEDVKRELQKYKEEQVKYKNEFIQRMNKELEKELNSINKMKNDFLQGSHITDDVKLFENKYINLTEEEVKTLANRYKDNVMMSRIIFNYAEKNNIKTETFNNAYSSNSEIDKKIKAINGAYGTITGLPNKRDIVKTILEPEALTPFDNILS